MGSITASCGHKVEQADGLIDVEFDDFHCDPVDGFVPVTVFASYCRPCAERLWKEQKGA